ncbi:hypothetical protein L13192_06320 [Pyrenophora tritici-repentis]|nr:hypothetical protein L13192_06320 [Pyrenophora tritici-repentis]
MKDQFEKLILQPLLEIQQACSQASARIVVIDALDECEQEQDIRTILQLLARTKDIRLMPLQIVVTSRPELHIRLGFKKMLNGTYQDLVLHEVQRSTIEHDLRVFLEHELGEIRESHDISTEWPAQHQVLSLAAEMSTSKSSWLDSYRLQITDHSLGRATVHEPLYCL